jgi:hypothetical protein
VKTLQEFLSQLGWSVTDLARWADINYRTAKKAVDGDVITYKSARAIAKALSEATGKNIGPGDIRGLVVG